jgi:hypothetical protein
MSPWVIAIFVTTLYLQLFNKVARMYLNSDRTMTGHDLYRQLVPAVKIHIEL